MKPFEFSLVLFLGAAACSSIFALYFGLHRMAIFSAAMTVFVAIPAYAIAAIFIVAIVEAETHD